MTVLLEAPVTTPVTQDAPATGKSDVAHIVRRNSDSMSPQAMVLDSRVNGTPLEALCGHIFMANKNPEHLPVCQECKAIYEYRLKPDQGKGLPDA